MLANRFPENNLDIMCARVRRRKKGFSWYKYGLWADLHLNLSTQKQISSMRHIDCLWQPLSYPFTSIILVFEYKHLHLSLLLHERLAQAGYRDLHCWRLCVFVFQNCMLAFCESLLQNPNDSNSSYLILRYHISCVV